MAQDRKGRNGHVPTSSHPLGPQTFSKYACRSCPFRDAVLVHCDNARCASSGLGGHSDCPGCAGVTQDSTACFKPECSIQFGQSSNPGSLEDDEEEPLGLGRPPPRRVMLEGEEDGEEGSAGRGFVLSFTAWPSWKGLSSETRVQVETVGEIPGGGRGDGGYVKDETLPKSE